MNNLRETLFKALPYNLNVMDISTIARKATTKAEKEKARKEERCFKCRKQGHLAKNCFNQKLRVRTTEIEEALKKEEEAKISSPADIAKWL